MYSSLVAWCRFPVNIHAFESSAASGDTQYKSPEAHNGYRVDAVELITDKYGEQYVSKSRVYFPPAVPVTESDLISFENTSAYEIRKIGGFYDGNTGQLDVLVIYL